jgi:hypothetical protein
MNTKRKLLLALSGASATAVWATPVVDAVVLPSHAETSPVCETSFEIAAATYTCSSPSFYKIYTLSLDSDGCLVVVESSGADACDPAANLQPNEVALYFCPKGGGAGRMYCIVETSVASEDVRQSCGGSDQALPIIGDSKTLGPLNISGTDYYISFTLSRTETTISHSIITFLAP